MSFMLQAIPPEVVLEPLARQLEEAHPPGKMLFGTHTMTCNSSRCGCNNNNDNNNNTNK